MAHSTRVERDSMGEMNLPVDALYGASTQRATENFPISGQRMPEGFLRALGLVKRACAKANRDLEEIDPDIADLIIEAATEVSEGKLSDHFPVDVFQTGSGTSTNMNANEVIANRCSQMAGHPLGSRRPAHPNDHVNRGQSSNDVIPTTLHVSVALALKSKLIPSLTLLETGLAAKEAEWRNLTKIGRTHLMDATPITLGQAFSGYARQAAKGISRCRRAIDALKELAIGGTAVGTGLNARPDFASLVVTYLAQDTEIEFREAANHFEAQAARDDSVEVAGQLCAVAACLTKIANDVRLLGSGPRAGFGELQLPPVQPGSSIMPGKVNPVICESVVQSSHYAIGLCQTVTRGGQDGHFELNANLPLIAHCLLTSIECLGNAARVFTEKCINGLTANEERCSELVERSLMLVTALNPHIGYDKAAEVAKKAFAEDKTLKQVVLEMGLMDEATVDEVLDPKSMR